VNNLGDWLPSPVVFDMCFLQDSIFVNRVQELKLEGDGLACKGLDKDLHTAMETEDKMESRLLDIVSMQPFSNCLPAKIKRS